MNPSYNSYKEQRKKNFTTKDSEGAEEDQKRFTTKSTKDTKKSIFLASYSLETIVGWARFWCPPDYLRWWPMSPPYDSYKEQKKRNSPRRTQSSIEEEQQPKIKSFLPRSTRRRTKYFWSDIVWFLRRTLMNRLVIVATLLIAVLSISSCILLRNYYDYYYIVPKNNSIETSASLVMPKLRTLSNHKAIPAAYYLKRPNYTVTFIPDLTTGHPTVFLHSKDNNGNLLTIHGGEKLGCGGFYQFTYDKSGKKIGRRKIIKYAWSPGFICRGKGDVKDQKIIFQVVGNNNEVIAEEKISFELKRNGHYYEIDAL